MKNSKIWKIVDKIKKQEEEKYGITFDIDTPTMVKYYIDNIKDKKISLDSSGIIKALMGVNSAGFAAQFSDNNYICVFNRGYELDYMLSDPILYFKNLKVSFKEFEISRILYHEIRHIVQAKRQDLFTPIEKFCFFQLSFTTSSKYYYDRDYHDSMYNEIDANIYSYEQLYLKYYDNPLLKKYIIKKLVDTQYLSCVYNFDSYFNKYSSYLKENKLKNAPYKESIDDYLWNEDGTFKSLSDVFSKLKDFPHNVLTIKLLTSDAFLNTIDFEKITEEEKVFLLELLKENDLLIDNQMEKLDYLVNERLISYSEYSKAFDFLRKQQERKDRYIKLIEKRKDSYVRKR